MELSICHMLYYRLKTSRSAHTCNTNVVRFIQLRFSQLFKYSSYIPTMASLIGLVASLDLAIICAGIGRGWYADTGSSSEILARFLRDISL